MDSYDITIQYSHDVDKYPAKSHARRMAESSILPAGLIVLEGTKTSNYPDSDNVKPFRQDRYFYYLSGCNEPDCILSYDIAKDWLTLYLPPVNWSRFYYDGRGINAEEALRKYDIDEAKSVLTDADGASLWAKIGEPECCPLITLASLHSAKDGIKVKSVDLKRALDKCRLVKDEYEIKMIRKANDISAQAHKDVLLQLHCCSSEAEAEAVYMRRCIANLAKEQSYEPIFGAGENASTLHYIKNDKPFGKSQLLLIDAGCEWQCYASDVTRTIPINRENPGVWPSKEAEQIYKAVEKIQAECIELMKPGNRFSQVSAEAQRLTIQALLDLGILKGDVKAIEAAGTGRAFLPHGLGHHVGLEVHDVQPPVVIKHGCRRSREYGGSSVFRGARQGNAPMMNNEQSSATSIPTKIIDPPMEPGNVITVEPGIYFNGLVLSKYYYSNPSHAKFIDLKVLQRFIHLGGVRIEDDILITKDGNENLTTAPKGETMMMLLQQAAKISHIS